MVDEVVFMLKMTAGDLALIYQLARSEKLGVGEWIMKCILEKVEKIQEEWAISQRIKAQQGGEK